MWEGEIYDHTNPNLIERKDIVQTMDWEEQELTVFA